MDAELREFGFRPPAPERWRWIAIVRGGPRARRRWAVALAFSAGIPVVAILLAVSCGSPGSGRCGVAPWFALGLLTVVGLMASWWYLAALPALWEDPRHPAVGGEFAAGPRTFPSEDVIFDPEYGRNPPRP